MAACSLISGSSLLGRLYWSEDSVLVQEPGQEWDGAGEVPGGVALVLHEGLGVSHVGPVVWVGGEH